MCERILFLHKTRLVFVKNFDGMIENRTFALNIRKHGVNISPCAVKKNKTGSTSGIIKM